MKRTSLPRLRRRDFIALLGGAAASWPLAARAQQPKVPVIGLLNLVRGEATDLLNALKEFGYIEGQNVALLFGAPGPPTPDAARELVDAQVAVIVVRGGYDWLEAAKAATSTIPIAYVGGTDPVKAGFAASLNHPGSNLTGTTYAFNAFVSKRLDLLLKLVPEVTTVGYLIEDPVLGEVDQLFASARILGPQIIVLECGTVGDIERAFATMAHERVGGLLVGAFPVGFNNRKLILTLAAEHRIPAMYAQSVYAREGGLMSYNSGGLLRQLAVQYVARILKGAKPSDLPIQQPTYFQFIINHKTARTLGLTFPATLELLADEAIE
jgi:putative ABC transport system substrate-binding protein